MHMEMAGLLSVGRASEQRLMKYTVTFGALVASFLLDFLAGLEPGDMSSAVIFNNLDSLGKFSNPSKEKVNKDVYRQSLFCKAFFCWVWIFNRVELSTLFSLLYLTSCVVTLAS